MNYVFFDHISSFSLLIFQFRFTCSGWPFQLKVISNMNETGVRKTGNNTLGNIDSKQPQIENSLFDKGLQKSDRGALSREYLTEEELRYEMPLTDIKLTVDVAASSLRLIGKK